MWLPSLLQDLERKGVYREMGMRVPPDAVYSLKEASITDAIVHFGGGCTASFISSKGLLLTNHHCGYGSIQDHSSVEKDLLKNGFWSDSMEDELKNPGLEATVIKGIVEVTEQMKKGVSDTMTETERDRRLEKNAQDVIADSIRNGDLEGKVRSFGRGDAHFLFLTQTFKDVRLVAAPPSSIGKFGGDEDNWIWPRHTGDFSLFRVYADPNNKPAKPSEENRPYRPEHVLPVSTNGIDPGDPTMMLGFPGSTRQFVPSGYLRFLKERNFPTRVRIRDAGLKVLDNAMRKNDSLRIQYAGKQSNISNYYKKWKGVIEGLERIDALERKKADEERFIDSAKAHSDEKAVEVYRAMQEAYKDYRELELARDLFIEFMYYGPDMIRFIRGFNDHYMAYGKAKQEGDLDSLIGEMKERGERFFEQHSLKVDKELFKAEAPIYRQETPEHLRAGAFTYVDSAFGGDMGAYVEFLYDSSAFLDPHRFDSLLQDFRKEGPQAVKDDPGHGFVNSFYRAHIFKVRPHYRPVKKRIDSLMRLHVADRREHMPGPHWYDANNTLRAGFGKIKGSSPRNGLSYHYATTLEGVMEKADSSERHFRIPDRLKKLYRERDFGPYGVNGRMPVCFTASIHSSGGNSGSPVLDAEGHLIGLNFDRSWESVMSDLMYDPSRCRNIATDIRYVLFLIDKLGNCDRLIEEIARVDRKERRKKYANWVEQDKDNPELRAMEAKLLLKEGQKKRARKRIDQAMKLGPSDPNYRVIRARSLPLEKGIEALEKAVQKQPGHASTWFALGELRLEKGQKEKAIDAFTRAIGADPELAKAYRARAKLYLDIGLEHKACKDIRLLEKIDPLALPRAMEEECERR